MEVVTFWLKGESFSLVKLNLSFVFRRCLIVLSLSSVVWPLQEEVADHLQHLHLVLPRHFQVSVSIDRLWSYGQSDCSPFHWTRSKFFCRYLLYEERGSNLHVLPSFKYTYVCQYFSLHYLSFLLIHVSLYSSLISTFIAASNFGIDDYKVISWCCIKFFLHPFTDIIF